MFVCVKCSHLGFRIRKRDNTCTTLELPQPAYTPYKSHNLPYNARPQSYYMHNTDAPVENEYEYVEDLKLPNNNNPIPPPPLPPATHNVPNNISSSYNVTNTGTGCTMHFTPPASPYRHPTNNMCISSGAPPPLPPNRLQGNEYVSDNSSTCSPKYFELDANKDHPASKKKNADIAKDMNEYTPQRNVQYFGHYSQ